MQDPLCRQRLRFDYTVQLKALDHFVKFDVVELCDDLLFYLTLCIFRQNGIDFVYTGSSRSRV